MVKLQSRQLTMMIALSVVVPVVAAVAPAWGQETVFVMSNNAERNQVIAFERKNDGSYFEQNRFDTFGRGSGGVNDPLEAQGSLALSSDHTLLFAANAGSGDITVFRVVGNSLRSTWSLQEAASRCRLRSWAVQFTCSTPAAPVP